MALASHFAFSGRGVDGKMVSMIGSLLKTFRDGSYCGTAVEVLGSNPAGCGEFLNIFFYPLSNVSLHRSLN